MLIAINQLNMYLYLYIYAHTYPSQHVSCLVVFFFWKKLDLILKLLHNIRLRPKPFFELNIVLNLVNIIQIWSSVLKYNIINVMWQFLMMKNIVKNLKIFWKFYFKKRKES